MFRRKKQNADIKVSVSKESVSGSRLFHRQKTSRRRPEASHTRSISRDSVEEAGGALESKKLRNRSKENSRSDFWFNQSSKTNAKVHSNKGQMGVDISAQAVNSGGKDSFFKKLDELEERSLHSSSKRKERLLSDSDASRLDLCQLIVRREWKRALEKLKENPAAAKKQKKMSLRGLGVTTALPIHLAVTKKPPGDFIDELIRAYPNGPKQPDKQWKRLPIHIGCICDTGAHVLQILLDAHPLSLRVVDQAEGRVPLHYVCRYGSPYEISLLMNAKKEALRVKDKHGKTPVDLARENPNQHGETIVRRLENTLRSMGVTSSHVRRQNRNASRPSVAAVGTAAASVASSSASPVRRRLPPPKRSRSIDSMATPDEPLPPPPTGDYYGDGALNSTSFGNLDFNNSLTLEEVQAISLLEYQQSQRMQSSSVSDLDPSESSLGISQQEHHRSITFEDEFLQGSLEHSTESLRPLEKHVSTLEEDEALARKLQESLNSTERTQNVQKGTVSSSSILRNGANTSQKSTQRNHSSAAGHFQEALEAAPPSISLEKSLGNLNEGVPVEERSDTSDDAVDPSSFHKSLGNISRKSSITGVGRPIGNGASTVSTVKHRNKAGSPRNVIDPSVMQEASKATPKTIGYEVDKGSTLAEKGSGDTKQLGRRNRLAEYFPTSDATHSSADTARAVVHVSGDSFASRALASVAASSQSVNDSTAEMSTQDSYEGEDAQMSSSQSARVTPDRSSSDAKKTRDVNTTKASLSRSSGHHRAHQLNLEISDDDMQPRSRKPPPPNTFGKPPLKSRSFSTQMSKSRTRDSSDAPIERNSDSSGRSSGSMGPYRNSYDYDSPAKPPLKWTEVAVGSAEVPTLSSSSHGRNLSSLMIDVPPPPVEKEASQGDDGSQMSSVQNAKSLLGSLRDGASETSSRDLALQAELFDIPRDPHTEGLLKEMEEQEHALEEKDSELSQLETHMNNLDLRRQALLQECEYVRQSAADKEAKAKAARDSVARLELELQQLMEQIKEKKMELELAESGAKVHVETLTEHEERIQATHTERDVLISIRANLLQERSIMMAKLESTRNDIKSKRELAVMSSALGERWSTKY